MSNKQTPLKRKEVIFTKRQKSKHREMREHRKARMARFFRKRFKKRKAG